MAEETPENVYRFTSVLTAQAGEIRYFRSPDEVPAPLRREFDNALRGEIRATITLADEGGQAYLRSRTQARRTSGPSAQAWRGWLVRRVAFEIAGAISVALLVFLFASAR